MRLGIKVAAATVVVAAASLVGTNALDFGFLRSACAAPLNVSSASACPLPTFAPVVSSYSPTSGAAGNIVTLSGSNLGSVTSVSFNGTSASFTVVSNSSITTTVPAGATTGVITVVSPNGTGASAGVFTIGSAPTNNKANIWVSPNGSASGSNCSWNSTPITNPDAGGSTLCNPVGAYAVWPSGCPGSGTGGVAVARMITTQGTYSNFSMFPTGTGGTVANKVCGGVVGQQCFPANEPFYDGSYSASIGGFSACLEYVPDGVDPTLDLSCSGTATVSTINIELPNVWARCLAGPVMTGPYSAVTGGNIGANPGRAPNGTVCSAWNVHDVILDNPSMTAFGIHTSFYVAVLSPVTQGWSALPSGAVNQLSNICTLPGGNTVGDHTVIDGGRIGPQVQPSWSNPQPLTNASTVVQSINATVSSASCGSPCTVTSNFPANPGFAHSLVVTVSADTQLSSTLNCPGWTLIKRQDFGAGGGGMAMFWKNNVGPAYPSTTPESTTVICTSTGNTNLNLVASEMNWVRVYPVQNVSGLDKTVSQGATATATISSVSQTPTTPSGCGTSPEARSSLTYTAVAKDGGGSFGAWGSGYTSAAAGTNIAAGYFAEGITSSATSTSQSWSTNANSGAITAVFKCENSNHAEGLHVNQASYLTVRNVKFISQDQQAISTQPGNFAGSRDDNLLYEGNVVDMPGNGQTLSGTGTNSFSGVVSGGAFVFLCGSTMFQNNIAVNYNTFEPTGGTPQSGGFACSTLGGPFNFTGNIFASGCPVAMGTGVVGNNLYNVYDSGTCGGPNGGASVGNKLVTDTNADYVAPGFSTYDYTLAAQATIDGIPNMVPAGQRCPPDTITGAARLQGTTCTPGAYGAPTVANKGTGGSVAVCNGTCSQGTGVTKVIQTTDANTNPLTVNRNYTVEIPTNLQCTQQLPCPLVFHVGGGPGTGDFWEENSPTQRYVLIYISPTHSGGTFFANPTTDPSSGVGASQFTNCGSPTGQLCDDIPQIQSILNAVVCYGAAPCLNIDPTKVFITGESKGATMAMDAICDVRTSSYFRGASLVSEAPALISDDNTQNTSPNCPALTGRANPAFPYGGASGLAPNTDISIQWQYGTNDGTGCGSKPVTCMDTGAVTNTTQWWFSNPQMAGEGSPVSPGTQTGSFKGPGHLGVGCSSSGAALVDTGSNSLSAFSNNGGHVTQTTYTGCTVSLRATQTIRISGGGHTSCNNAIDTWDCARQAYDFLSNH